MADLIISELPALLGADLEAADDIAVADYSASETRRLTAKDLVQNGVQLVDANIIPGAKIVTNSITALQIAADAITASELADDAVDTAAIEDAAVVNAKVATGTLTGDRFVADTITATEIAADAITASELADNAVDTAAIQALAVTDAKIADGIDGAKITDGTVTNAELATGIDGAKLIADSVTSTEIGPSAITSSELADDSVDTAAIQDLAVTDAKIADGIDGAKITDGTVTNAELATGIEGAKLVDGSVVDAKLATGIDGAKLTNATVTDAKIVGLDGAKVSDGTIVDSKLADGIDGAKITDGTVTNAELATGIDGGKLTDDTVVDAKIANGLDGAKITDDTLTAAKVPATSLDRGIDKTSGSIGLTNSVTAGSHSGISFDAQGLITGTSAIQTDELPIATATTVGVSSYPTVSGLSVSGVGEVTHTDAVTAGTTSGITFNASGHITGAVALQGSDLPLATSTTAGGVKVPGPVLTLDGSGGITHVNSSVVPGAYPKVTVDTAGHVTAGTELGPDDIPSLDASKITSGTFGSGLLAANSVTATQLADYGIAKIGSSQPTPEFAGQLWVNPTDRTAYVWVGQVEPAEGYYLPLNNEFGAQANLRFGGTYNANTNTIATLNTYGSGAGLTVGSALSAPTSSSVGVYLLVTTLGTGTSPAPAVALDVGDWLLSPGSGTTWTHVNLVGAGISVVDANDVTYDGTGLTPPFSGIADAGTAIDTLWGRTQIATAAVTGIVLESTEITVDNTTGAMALGVVDEGSY